MNAMHHHLQTDRGFQESGTLTPMPAPMPTGSDASGSGGLRGLVDIPQGYAMIGSGVLVPLDALQNGGAAVSTLQQPYHQVCYAPAIWPGILLTGEILLCDGDPVVVLNL